MRENGMELRRLALSRSALFPGAGEANYWSTPRAAISGRWLAGRVRFEFRSPPQRPARHPDSDRLPQVKHPQPRPRQMIDLPHGGHSGIGKTDQA